MKQIPVNGVNIYPFTSETELLAYVDEHKGILVAINSGKIYNATEQTRNIINRNIGYCDGVGAVMALKKKGCKNICKIAGCELWLKIVDKFYKDKSFYLVGSKPEVVEQVVEKLKVDYLGINIIDYRDGYIKTKEEELVVVNHIAATKPDVVFVAMGSPKQELLMEEMQKLHPTAIYQGLGGSFDVYTGRIKRAPKCLIRLGMEGPYRVLSDLSILRIKRFFIDLMFILKVWLGQYK